MYLFYFLYLICLIKMQNIIIIIFYGGTEYGFFSVKKTKSHFFRSKQHPTSMVYLHILVHHVHQYAHQ